MSTPPDFSDWAITECDGKTLNAAIEAARKAKRSKAPQPRTHDELASRYAAYIEEMVDRVWTVISATQNIQGGNTVNEFSRIDLDLCYLQMRKAIECLAYAISLFHRVSKKSLSENKLRTYKVGQIFKELEKRNPKFFPVPSKMLETKGGLKLVERKPVRAMPNLTRRQAEQIYSIVCGNELHADHDYSRLEPATALDRSLFLNHAARAVLGLLSYHSIGLDEKYILLAGTGDMKKPGSGAFAQITTATNRP